MRTSSSLVLMQIGNMKFKHITANLQKMNRQAKQWSNGITQLERRMISYFCRLTYRYRKAKQK